VINTHASRVPKFSKRMQDGLLLWSVFSIMTVDSDPLSSVICHLSSVLCHLSSVIYSLSSGPPKISR
jgi:hypothetical protein